jgi:hypothetical protein
MMCLRVRARLCGWGFLAVLFVGCGGSENEAPELRAGVTVLEDDFSDRSTDWPSGVSEKEEYGYVDGAYRILLKQDLMGFNYSELEPSRRALRLEIEATQLAGSSGDGIGALCYTDVLSDVGYMFEIIPVERSVLISAFRGDDYRDLYSEEAVDAVRPEREENRLRIECIGSPDGPNVLTLAVNGESLGRAQDERGRSKFDGVGFFVNSMEGGSEALFDNLVVTTLEPR